MRASTRHILEFAARAPSIHNTQPWRWAMTDSGLDLHADHRRQLPAADPLGRNLVISCGAALHHVEVAARALGWRCAVRRFPDGSGSALLARVSLSPGVPSETAQADLKAIADRCTDRRRFTTWPVPDQTLQRLARAADERGGRAIPLVDVTERFQAEMLVGRAVDEQAVRPDIRSEQEEWIDHSLLDGVPSTALPASRPTGRGGRPSRFPDGQLPDSGRELEGSDGLVVLCGSSDGPESWLLAGEALSSLWLTATRMGLSVVPLSQVIEVETTRRDLGVQVLGGMQYPHLLVRIGWQVISRSQLPRTGRRPVDDLLLP